MKNENKYKAAFYSFIALIVTFIILAVNNLLN